MSHKASPVEAALSVGMDTNGNRCALATFSAIRCV